MLPEDHETLENLTAELRSAYRDVRARFGLTLRDVSTLLDLSAVTISRLERKPPILTTTDEPIERTCAYCEQRFTTKLVLIDGQPMVFGTYCCPECRKKETV